MVVNKGVCWAISNGHNLNIWSTPCIPSLLGFKSTPNPNLLILPELNIAHLINPIHRSWNPDLLNSLFDPSSVLQISNIHLSQNISPERWVWAPSSSGLFYVKSAHEVDNLGNPFTPHPS